MLVTVHNFPEVIEFINQTSHLAIDTETNGLRPWNGHRVIGISISGPDTSTQLRSYYAPFQHNDGYNLPRENLFQLYNALLNVPKLIFFNAKFDLQFMYQDGFRRFEGWEDVQVMAHLLESDEPSFALKKLADKYLGPGSSKDEAELTQLIKKKFGQKAKKGEIWRLRSDEVEAYACSDTELTYRLWEFYLPHLEEWGLSQLYKECTEYLQILNRIETYGVLMDVEWIKEMKVKAQYQVEDLTKKIYEEAGFELNPSSPKQLTEFFGTESSNKETLETLDHPLAKIVLEFRHWKKLASTYLDSYLEMVDDDNVLHATFNIHGTVAGRLSSSDPNLQNVPPELRRAFIARPGYVMVEADYQAAEMRLAAYFSGEPRLKKIFREGGDPHQMVADEMSIVLGHEVSRQDAKTINFGKIYGMQAPGFSKKFGVSIDEAERYVDTYDSRFPALKELYYSAQQHAAQKGFIRLPTGRIRRFRQPTSRFQTAMNNLIQGTAAEVVRYAMNRIYHRVPEAKMLLQVHDSILFEVKESELEYTLKEVKSLMEAFDFDPPMKAEFKIGSSWGEMKPIEI